IQPSVTAPDGRGTGKRPRDCTVPPATGRSRNTLMDQPGSSTPSYFPSQISGACRVGFLPQVHPNPQASARALLRGWGAGRVNCMPNVTQLLEDAAAGNPNAASDLLPLVYDELRALAAAKLAAERPGQTLQATALVHEAYLRLIGGADGDPGWDNRGHFFAA